MARLSFILILSAFSLASAAASSADEHRLSFLEQEVRNLQRTVQSLTRQVEELRRPGPMSRRATSPIIIEGGAKADGELPAWVNAALWQKVRRGMSELDAITLLGKPTSLREADGGHQLLYALELGPSAFLGGSVTVRDRVVVDLRQPTLQ